MTTENSTAFPIRLDDIVAKPLEKKSKRLPLSGLSINVPLPLRKSGRLGDTPSASANASKAKPVIDTSSAIVIKDVQADSVSEAHSASQKIPSAIAVDSQEILESVSKTISSTSIRSKRNRKPNVPYNAPEGKRRKITLAMHITKYGSSHQIEIC